MATNNPNSNIDQKVQKEINKLAGETQRYWQGILDSLIQTGAPLEKFESVLSSVRRSVKDTGDDLNDIKGQFHSITDELRAIATEEDKAKKSLSEFNDISKKILEGKNQGKKISSDELKDLQSQAKAKADEALATGKLNDIEQAIISRLVEQNQYIDQQLEKLKEEEKIRADIDQKLKVTKSIIKGISDIPLLGNLVDTEAGLEAATTAAGEGAGAMGQMGAAAKAMGQSLKQSLGPIGLILMAVEELQKAIKLADGGAGDLAKDFNITYDAANRVRGQLADIAEESGDINITTKGLQESMVAVGKTLGSNAALNKKDLVFMTQMREMAGFTNEELVEMEKYTLATGGNLEENTKNLMYGAKMASLGNKVMLNEKDIMKDVAKAGAAVKISIQGGAEALGRAAAQAKAVGLSLDKVNDIAGSLMDFESSINAELEAQLLTGKNINLEQARLYAINNDMEGLSREIAKNVGTSAEFSKMNRLQQDAIAKAVGMNRDEVAQMLVDKEALQGLSGKEAEDAKKALDWARAKGMTEEEIKQKGIDGLKQQQSVQERLEKSQEKMKELFIQIAEPILDIVSPLADIVGEILPPILGILQPILGTFKAIGHVIASIVKALTGDFTGALKSLNEVPGDIAGGFKNSTQFKVANKLTGGKLGDAIGGIETPEANVQAAGDLYSPADGKTRISTKEGGLFELSDNDTVIAAPSRGSNNQSSPDNSKMIAELQEIKSILRQTLSIDMEIAKKSSFSSIFDGGSLFTDKRGTQTNVNTYKTQ